LARDKRLCLLHLSKLVAIICLTRLLACGVLLSLRVSFVLWSENAHLLRCNGVCHIAFGIGSAIRSRSPGLGPWSDRGLTAGYCLAGETHRWSFLWTVPSVVQNRQFGRPVDVIWNFSATGYVHFGSLPTVQSGTTSKAAIRDGCCSAA